MKNQTKYKVAIAGATGLVGTEIIGILGSRRFPVDKLKLLASEDSAGEIHEFRGEALHVSLLEEDAFIGVDIAFFATNSELSRKYVPCARSEGAVVIDNSAAYRMDMDVPLVVPEVNGFKLVDHDGMIANPNCSTVQLVMVLKPLLKHVRIKRVVVSTYQAVSGWGKRAMDELIEQVRDLLTFKEIKVNVFSKQIAFNCIPQIDVFTSNGNTGEEEKIINETRKILDMKDFRITATAVRVPVFNGHSQAVTIEFDSELSVEKARDILTQSTGIVLLDDPANSEFPVAVQVTGHDEVYAGRIRKDHSVEYGLNLWTVSDNLRKGAALNAVQIAEELIKLPNLGRRKK
ncbi:MAG: aspartate-semialdehyde dehydrogenase [Candidatus Schekmanbacteria bacterium RBG_13_48_7]|uniref:Aspartate-semialdehyde dehydrogenase n=1 Tax=Candidatus Schekmanbacteria bacterium RBG_13_48_7 TaxID=1817878 RepID=A0A1F7RWP9_9BACT|nr:MAG: aspartate-semialdehyde dehydrogenase [Candidatus Schekmanbacteria bacterium RBG_13_48_7]